MSKDNVNKGQALEGKVAELLEALFRYDPKLKTSDFAIKLNETVYVNKVPYQIDVWVETLKSSPYRSTFVYECKNWKRAVGKAQVDSLAKTVEAVGATSGFLVAEKFSKHARTLVESEKRIQLMECSDEFSDHLNVEARHVIYEPTKLTVTYQAWDATELFPDEKALRSQICHYRGKEMSFDAFQDIWMREFFAFYEQTKPPFVREYANHFASFEKEFSYEPGQLLIGNIQIARMRLLAKFFVYFEPMHLVSKFELKGKGRTCTLVSKTNDFSAATLELNLLLGA